MYELVSFQSVKHVLEECRWGSEARSEYEKGSKEGVEMEKLLYRKEGVDWACKIWYEFVEGRKRWLEGRG